ncbi:hypothetical protein EV646_101275 [Kribbella antiqua]|uniref:Uncharacterized protein n=1 Tax=Kribbella antiqua TaxID=2512217 RepID=A0A4R2J1I0_9ACTN|nr:DUF6401 family natural product biosynthesis protein [Kribbella antiqua]TCO51292.1 hypothetical protein EV646_101275 [Kribbella antiqua]
MTWLRRLHEAAARQELTMLRDRLTPNFASLEPALHAAVDQHAAAIRDILGLTAGRAGPVELAAYARGVRDVAADQGWQTGRIDWVTIRLLAAVSLALPSQSPVHDLPAI